MRRAALFLTVAVLLAPSAAGTDAPATRAEGVSANDDCRLNPNLAPSLLPCAVLLWTGVTLLGCGDASCEARVEIVANGTTQILSDLHVQSSAWSTGTGEQVMTCFGLAPLGIGSEATDPLNETCPRVCSRATIATDVACEGAKTIVVPVTAGRCQAVVTNAGASWGQGTSQVWTWMSFHVCRDADGRAKVTKAPL
ncbi:MAG TPA: hypothetical protein VHH36_08230 [Candidatus Thermoplasmatota archaeon]|nr:hypothetical protein [Candidatus Thermoplasmatota archaeon]